MSHGNRCFLILNPRCHVQIARTRASKEYKRQTSSNVRGAAVAADTIGHIGCIRKTRVPMLRARNSLSIDAVARIARKRASAMCTYENINYLNGIPYTVDFI